ncbi:MAG: O-methyltransferase [Flavobacteriales bacterium]
MNLILEGIKYHLQAKKRQGIHSPFVYELTSYLRAETMDTASKEALKQLAIDVKKQKDFFETEDFGAGSKHFGNLRNGSSLYRTSATKGKYGHLLYKLIKHLKPDSILEFGTSLGIGTLQMHFGNQSAFITTVEGSKKVAEIANETIKRYAIKPEKIQIIQSTFNQYLDVSGHEQFDFIYVDGHHDGEALLNYIDRLKPRMNEKTVVLIDDIRWSNSMFQSWKTLCNDPWFSVSIDFFRMGCLCIRKHQAKEHFILKN